MKKVLVWRTSPYPQLYRIKLRRGGYDVMRRDRRRSLER
jgi:hypothetical protein